MFRTFKQIFNLFNLSFEYFINYTNYKGDQWHDIWDYYWCFTFTIFNTMQDKLFILLTHIFYHIWTFILLEFGQQQFVAKSNNWFDISYKNITKR